MRKALLRTVWLRPAPDAPPDRQLLFGDPFEATGTRDGWAEGRGLKDNYEGWVPEEALGPAAAPSHWVAVRSTWGYAAPDIRSEAVVDLHMTCRLDVAGESDGWAELRFGEGSVFVPVRTIRPWAERGNDPVEAARAFLGVPYLWAGNTGFGLDCSGLVQVAFHACGRACAADSQTQAAMPGEGPDEVQPGDLIFWKDHVAIETGEGTLIHANTHHMCVVEEPRHSAMQRIAAGETGPVTARLRPERRELV